MRCLTLADIMALAPGAEWTRQRVRELMRGQETITAYDILDAEQVPARDRIWLLIRGQLLERNDLILIAVALAERVLPLYTAMYPHDQRPAHAIQAALACVHHIDDYPVTANASYAATAATTAATDTTTCANRLAAFESTQLATAVFAAALAAAVAGCAASVAAAESSTRAADSAIGAVNIAYTAAETAGYVAEQYYQHSVIPAIHAYLKKKQQKSIDTRKYMSYVNCRGCELTKRREK